MKQHPSSTESCIFMKFSLRLPCWTGLAKYATKNDTPGIVHNNERKQVLKHSNQIVREFRQNSVFSDEQINGLSGNLSSKVKLRIIRQLRNTPVFGRLKRSLKLSSKYPIRAFAKICVYLYILILCYLMKTQLKTNTNKFHRANHQKLHFYAEKINDAIKLQYVQKCESVWECLFNSQTLIAL